MTFVITVMALTWSCMGHEILGLLMRLFSLMGEDNFIILQFGAEVTF